MNDMHENFDVVVNSRNYPVFSGTPENVVEWLKKDPEGYDEVYEVILAKTMEYVPVKDYIAVKDYITQAEKTALAKRDMERYNKVLELVHDAIWVQDPNAHAHETTTKIMEIFK